MGYTNVTIQATGNMPINFRSTKQFSAADTIDKREVKLDVYMDTEDYWWYRVALESCWKDERLNSMVGGPFTGSRDDVELMVCAIHFDSESILPPGAGYPATPDYESRQEKLNSQMYWLSLSCLSKVLFDIHRERDQTP